MPFDLLTRKKLRAKIIRKGVFSQLKYLNTELERENRMFRAILDGLLYDATSENENIRREALLEINLNNKEFKDICMYAWLDYIKVYNMLLFLLKKYFYEFYEEHSCLIQPTGGIVKTQTVQSNIKDNKAEGALNAVQH